jgi:signal transduction histidine kinase
LSYFDIGPGIVISEKNLNNLFKIDQNISSKGTLGETGTRLGLILCREFIAKNGGDIFIESKLNKGSKFNFTLPLFSDRK